MKIKLTWVGVKKINPNIFNLEVNNGILDFIHQDNVFGKNYFGDNHGILNEDFYTIFHLILIIIEGGSRNGTLLNSLVR